MNLVKKLEILNKLIFNKCAGSKDIGVITSDTTVFGMSFKLKSHPIFTLDGYPEIYYILDKNSPNCTLLDFISIP